MNIELWLTAYIKTLEFATEWIKSIPKEQHAAFWARHERNLDFLEDMFTKGVKPKAP